MITDHDLLIIHFNEVEWSLISHHASFACVGGSSCVRPDRADRMGMIGEDQIVGQAFEAGIHLCRDGHLFAYDERRRWFNANPHASDNGIDIVWSGVEIDVKGSLMRSERLGILDYRLPVQPHEMHDNRIYVLGLMSREDMACRRIVLVGWVRREELPTRPEGTKAFPTAHTVKARNLHPLPKYKIPSQRPVGDWLGIWGTTCPG